MHPLFPDILAILAPLIRGLLILSALPVVTAAMLNPSTGLLTPLLTIPLIPARRYASVGLCDSDVSVCLSVCPTVRHTLVLCLAERKQDREMHTV